MGRLQVYLSNSFDPHLNLAVEEWIFHNLNPDQQILFLWRNQNTVVIGRNQNPWSECNLEKMKADGIHLARRTTGGGAVFHDLGNTNFTFLSPKAGYKRETNLNIILKALSQFGIKGDISGRNDLTVAAVDGPRKFSGSAFREKMDRAFHHGTVLMNADLTRLAQYLTPHPKKMQAKGKESVRARVLNLNEIAPGLNHDEFVMASIHCFEEYYEQKAPIEILDASQMESIPELKAQYDQLRSWDWLYGRTLDFSHHFEEYLSLGFFDIRLQVDEAIINEAQIFSDCLFPALIQDLKSGLVGKAYVQDSIEQVFSPISARYPDLTEGLCELKNWMARQIEV